MAKAHKFAVEVEVKKDLGAATARSVIAYACVRRSGKRRTVSERGCGVGVGRTARAATKKALRALASKV